MYNVSLIPVKRQLNRINVVLVYVSRKQRPNHHHILHGSFQLLHFSRAYMFCHLCLTYLLCSILKTKNYRYFVLFLSNVRFSSRRYLDKSSIFKYALFWKYQWKAYFVKYRFLKYWWKMTNIWSIFEISPIFGLARTHYSNINC